MARNFFLIGIIAVFVLGILMFVNNSYFSVETSFLASVDAENQEGGDGICYNDNDNDNDEAYEPPDEEPPPEPCINECFVEGYTICADSESFLFCTDTNSDDCLEWLGPLPCGPEVSSCGSETCNDSQRPNWYCDSATNSCKYNCVNDPSCSVCTDECSYQGQAQCSDDVSYQICGDYDTDPCLEWGPSRICTGDTTCGYGGCGDNKRPTWYCKGGGCYYDCIYDLFCGALCVDECFSGQTRCVGINSYQDCGDYDLDDCLEWGAYLSCVGDTSCGYGSCADNQKPSWYCDSATNSCQYSCLDDSSCLTCTDECSFGQTRCSDDKNYQICENYDTDPCLEWGYLRLCSGDTSCGYGSCTDNQKPSWYCEGGACYYTCLDDSSCDVPCTDECYAGEARCSDTTHYQTCGSFYDDDSCLEWSSPQSCVGDTSCGYGGCGDNKRPTWYCKGGGCYYDCIYDLFCGALCVDECFSGQTRCVGINSYQDCGDYDLDDCLEWGAYLSCVGDTSCGYGSCADNQKPSWYCDSETNSCQYSCLDDSSCLTCTDECSPEGSTRCSTYYSYQTCVSDYDDDPCLEWSLPQFCESDTSCGYGVCNDNQRPANWHCSYQTNSCEYYCEHDSTCCLDDCSEEGETRCFGDYMFQTCVSDYDDDPCLEWSSPQSCEGDYSCGAGGCRNDQAPNYYCDNNKGSCAVKCVSGCTAPGDCLDECPIIGGTIPETICFGKKQYKVCGNFDLDECLELSEPQDCPLYEISCGYGKCVKDQRPYNWRCENGECIYDCFYDEYCLITGGCTNDSQCTGDTSCGYGTCTNSQRPSWYCNLATGNCAYNCLNDPSCLITTGCTSDTDCPSDTSCGGENCSDTQIADWYCNLSLGQCRFTCVEDPNCRLACQDECSRGQAQCTDWTHRKICGDFDRDVCLEWSERILCEGSTVCGYGTCTDEQRPTWMCLGDTCLYQCNNDPGCQEEPPICEDDCSSGQGQCFDENHYQICGYFDNDLCLDWSSERLCQGEVSCGYGECEPNEISSWYCDSNLGICNYSCLVDEEACPIAVCENECPERWLSQCTDDWHYQLCGIYWDDDMCLEWGPSKSCTLDNSCGYKDCQDNQRPIWYCQEGTGNCLYDCFDDEGCIETEPDYIKYFRKDCYDDDVYWFDSEGVVNDKAEECSDDDPQTLDVCEDAECLHLLAEIGSNYYCQTYEHCGDGYCNCDEDTFSCFVDCELVNLAISIFGRKESSLSPGEAEAGEWKEKIIIGPKEKMDILLVVTNDSQEDFANITVRVELPPEIIYQGDLKIEKTLLAEDIRDGIIIVFLPSGSEKIITFKTEVSPEVKVETETEIIATAEVEILSDSDSMKITIEKAKKGILVWLIRKWWLWLLLWILFILLLYWILRRKREEKTEGV